MFAPAFPIYHMTAENEGRVPVFVGMGDDLDFKWDDYVAAITPDVRIVFLTNPHSPTARLITLEHIRDVCEAAKDQLVVLDEAYIHFSRTNGGMDLLREFENLIVLRTMSKVFGLAGLRVGFGIAATPTSSRRCCTSSRPGTSASCRSRVRSRRSPTTNSCTRPSTRSPRAAYVMENRPVRPLHGGRRAALELLPVADRGQRPRFDQGVRRAAKRGVIVKDGSVSFIGLGEALPADRRQPEAPDGSPALGAVGHPQCGLSKWRFLGGGAPEAASSSARAMNERVSTHVNGDRLWRRLMELARFGATESGGVNRSRCRMRRSRRGLNSWWGSAIGLDPSTDAVANLFLSLPGTDPGCRRSGRLPYRQSTDRRQVRRCLRRPRGPGGRRSDRRARRAPAQNHRGRFVDERGGLAVRAGHDGIGRLHRRAETRGHPAVSATKRGSPSAPRCTKCFRPHRSCRAARSERSRPRSSRLTSSKAPFSSSKARPSAS